MLERASRPPTCPNPSSSPCGTNTVGRACGPGETTMTRTHKLVNLAGIVLPLVGLVIAVVVLWERMVGPDRARDPRRRLRAHRRRDHGRVPPAVHASVLRDVSRCSLHVRRPRRDGGRGRRGRLGLGPSEAPPVLRRGRRPAQSARRVSARASSPRCAGSGMPIPAGSSQRLVAPIRRAMQRTCCATAAFA